MLCLFTSYFKDCSFIFLVFLASLAFFLSGCDLVLGVLDRFSRCNSTNEYSGKKILWGHHQHSKNGGNRRENLEGCDIFSGKWVYDNRSHPLYNERECPFMSDQLACHKHGRSDLDYQYWRWQPHNCNLKRCFPFLCLVTCLDYEVLFVCLF